MIACFCLEVTCAGVFYIYIYDKYGHFSGRLLNRFCQDTDSIATNLIQVLLGSLLMCVG